jgi:chromosome segregation ATPase
MDGKRRAQTRFRCRDCGFERPVPVHPGAPGCPACGWTEGAPTLGDSLPDAPRAEIIRTRQHYETLSRQTADLRLADQPALALRVAALTEREPPGAAADAETLRQTVGILETDLVREQHRRAETEQLLQEAVARLEAFQTRTEESVHALQHEKASLTERLAEATAASTQIEHDAETLRRQAEAAITLGRQIDWLEEENVALRHKLASAERTLHAAAQIAERIESLQGEIDRLGGQYLRAREEAREAKAARDQVEDALAQVVDRFLAASPTPPPASPAELNQARNLIRRVSDHLDTPPTS